MTTGAKDIPVVGAQLVEDGALQGVPFFVCLTYPQCKRKGL
ncbi:MAG: hypothetical protein ACXVB0_01605 [Mucilaginibacter sp.]